MTDPQENPPSLESEAEPVASDVSTKNAESLSEPAPAEDNPAPVIEAKKIYLRDAVFEQPNSPPIFESANEPNIKVELSSYSEKISEEEYEVWVKIAIKSVIDQKIQFAVEIEQAGLFTIRHVSIADLPETLAVTCANILYPYLRFNIADLVMRGGFEPVNLTEINFHNLYEQRLALRAKQVNAQ